MQLQLRQKVRRPVIFPIAKAGQSVPLTPKEGAKDVTSIQGAERRRIPTKLGGVTGLQARAIGTCLPACSWYGTPKFRSCQGEQFTRMRRLDHIDLLDTRRHL